MIARLAAATAAALLLVACGSGGDDDGRYDARVDEVRDAVEAGDRNAALASLDQLGTEAFAAHAEGEVSDEELAALAGLLEQARAQLDDELPETTTTTEATTTTTAPPTTQPAPALDRDSDEKEDDEKKKDKGKDEGGDDGDDDDDD